MLGGAGSGSEGAGERRKWNIEVLNLSFRTLRVPRMNEKANLMWSGWAISPELFRSCCLSLEWGLELGLWLLMGLIRLQLQKVGNPPQHDTQQEICGAFWPKYSD